MPLPTKVNSGDEPGYCRILRKQLALTHTVGFVAGQVSDLSRILLRQTANP